MYAAMYQALRIIIKEEEEEEEEAMNDIVTALGLGACAFAKGGLSDAGKDAYQMLKNAILRIVSQGDINKLEQKPNSENRKAIIFKELDEAGKAEDIELARLAQILVSALKETDLARGKMGISLEEVEAVNVRLQRIVVTSGTGASITKSKITDLEVTDVHVGAQPVGKTERQ